uniref:Si:ch211-13k12.2 n=1 Tax=Oryzias latipes TaxID=8090 RepID=A0A3P9K5A5_ORYLA
MAALRQEHRYGLSCGKINKNTPNRTLYHVKLTDTAIRTLEAYQNLKASLTNQPAICFKGNQGYVKIPAPSPESPDGFRVFSFYLSSDSKDKPQSSFDCIHQYVSGEGRDHLEGQGSIQDKITVCATDDSYQTTRERMSQVEKDIWSRTAIEIKPGPSRCVKVQRKHGLMSGPDISSKHSPNNKRGLLPSPVAHRPLKERIIHLLALKPYRKPEVLLWLERERASLKDKAELMPILEEVGKLNPKDQSYSLKDEFYRCVQKDWAGYLEEEKQLIHRLLIRKLQPSHSNQLRSPQSNHSFHKSPGDSPLHLSPAKNLSVKRPLTLETFNIQSPKRQKLSEQRMPPNSPSHTDCGLDRSRSSSTQANSNAQIKAGLDKTNNHLMGIPDDLYSPQKLTQSPTVSKLERTEAAPPAPSPKPQLNDSSISTDQQLANGQHKKKRSKKHKDKERERLKPGWIETSPDLKQNQENLKDHQREKTPVNGTSAEEVPDYLIKYSSITSLELRQQYSSDFCAEYDEYRALHDRIGAITEMFVQLGSKINTLSPGTQEYKLMEEQILQKYQKFKKVSSPVVSIKNMSKMYERSTLLFLRIAMCLYMIYKGQGLHSNVKE